jgi:hypothetical protein
MILPSTGISNITIDHSATAVLFFSFLKVITKALIIKISQKIKTINVDVGFKSFILYNV